jgi:hypothetical protein
MSSYVSFVIYRSRDGGLMAYAEDSTGRTVPYSLTADQRNAVLCLAHACGARLPRPECVVTASPKQAP